MAKTFSCAPALNLVRVTFTIWSERFGPNFLQVTGQLVALIFCIVYPSIY